MKIYKKYDDGIYRIREIFGLKITTKPLENRLLYKLEKVENKIENKIDSIYNYNYKLERKIDQLDIRNKARIQILSLGDKKIIEEKRKERLIISLTTFPQRIYDIDVVLFSLLNQTIKADKIILWLGREEFPNLEDSVPIHILNMRKFGIEIKFCHNLKQYNKLIYSLKEFPNDIIITVDDDIYYQYDTIEKLYNAYLEDPNYIYCHRGHVIKLDDNNNILPINNWYFHYLSNDKEALKPSFRHYFTGVGGVLYKANFLHNDIFNEELFMKLAPTEDDFWFMAMAILKGTKTGIVKNNNKIIEIGYDNYKRLWNINRTGLNQKTFDVLLDYYGDRIKNRIISDEI